MRPFTLIRALCGAAGWLLAAATPCHDARAAEPAATPLRLIVPVAPGGSSDLVARALAAPLARALARPVVVENRPGATGAIAVDVFRSLPPQDALLVTPVAALATTPFLSRHPSYRPEDLAPVTRLTTFDYALAVAADHPARDFPRFVAWARAHPGATNFAGSGKGSIPHLAGLAIARAAGFTSDFVPYASIARLEVDLMGHQVVSAVAATTDLLPLHRAGRVRLLAVSGPARRADLPDVPTFVELGYPTLRIEGWNGLFANPRIAPGDVERIARAVDAALHDDAVVAPLRAAGLQVAPTTPEAFRRIIARDIAYWPSLLRASGVTTDAP